MTTIDYQSELKKCLTTQATSLQRHVLSERESVWVRRLNKGNPKINYVLMRLLTQYIFRIPLLNPVYRGPKVALQDEANRLLSLEKSDILAPRLRALSDDGLMMSDLSLGKEALKTLNDVLETQGQSAEEILAFWSAGLTALNELHLKNQYCSQAFIRNILYVESGSWAFIDFEEDPASCFTLNECQVRDLLFFLQSSAYLLTDKEDEALAFLHHLIENRPPTFQTLFYKTLHKASILRYFSVMKYLGRDGRRLYQVVQFIVKLQELNKY